MPLNCQKGISDDVDSNWLADHYHPDHHFDRDPSVIIPLNESISATFSNGRAVGRLTPGTSGIIWYVKKMVTTVSGTGITPATSIELVVYRNVETEATKEDFSSYSAAQDVSQTDIEVPASDSLLAVWTADVSLVPDGSVGTLILSGRKETGRR